MYDPMGKAWAPELGRLLWLEVSLMGTRYGCETGYYCMENTQHNLTKRQHRTIASCSHWYFSDNMEKEAVMP